MSNAALTIGSLFAGVGGFDLGFERAGFDTAWVVEWDKDCQHVLRRHFPNAKLYGDITAVDPAELEKVDVITYGFPCTDLSVAGKRKGLKHDGENTRSGLFFEAVRIIQHVQPRLAVFENVPGLLSSSRGRDFAVVLRDLARIGYGETVYVTLDSQHFGVAQRRRRVFGISAHSSCPGLAERCAEEIHAQSKGVRGDSAAGEEAREGTPVSAQDGVGSVGEYPPLTGTLDRKSCSSNRGSQANEAEFIVPEVAPTLRKMGHDASHANGGGQVAVAFRACGQDGFTPGEVSPPIAESDGGGSGVPTALHGDYRDRLPGEKDDDYWQRMTDYEREHGIDPTATQVQWASGGGKIENPTAQALRTGAEHNYQFARTGMTVRRLTPVECERLQGFPDGHTEWGIDEKGNRVNLSDSARYRQMGNAVTVNVAEFLGRIIAKALT